MGDLIQGDCGNGPVHRKMLDDVMNRFKEEFGGLPFVTVVGNHDIRGVDAKATYHDYMPGRMSEELGKKIEKTTFSFNIGDDAYIVLDFNNPDNDEIEKLLAETAGARNTFVITHGPLFPMDEQNCRWFFHGSAKHTEERRHFRAEFARRNVICLCGHSHRTRLTDWSGDGGRIIQMEMNSVWSSDAKGVYKVDSEGPEAYGAHRKSLAEMPDGSKIVDESPLFDEYRPGIRRYVNSNSAGSYKLNVSGKHCSIDFYAGDSTRRSETFKLR